MDATIERVEDSPRRVLLFGLALAAAGAAAYANAFRVPLLLDDAVTLGGQAAPGFASPVAGRPILRWSFELNRAWTGSALWSYHAVNLAIHLAAGLVLFGLVRRVLALPPVAGLAEPGSGGPRPRLQIAALAAAVWLLHPLVTESVTYLSQRAESLMGLFYLLTLYAHVRGCRIAAIACCWLGMATKETMVTAPLAVLLLDVALAPAAARWTPPWRARRPAAAEDPPVASESTPVASKGKPDTADPKPGACDGTPVTCEGKPGAFDGEPIASRGEPVANCGKAVAYYAALFASWALLACLMLRSHVGERGVGFATGVGALRYLLTEFAAVAHYVQLAIWPRPLVFDYGFEVLGRSDVWNWFGVVIVGGGLLAAMLAWRRCRPIGYLIFLFFLLLAPTSSVVPIALSPIAESRMYLPLAVLVVLAVLALGRWWKLLIIAVPLLGVLTFARNRTYRSSESIWADTVAKAPRSSRAHNNYALALSEPTAAVEHFEAALRLNPDYAEAENNLALVLADLPGKASEAAAHYQAALRLQPEFAEAHANYGTLLARRLHQPSVAIGQFREALQLRPDFAEAHNDLGMTLLGLPGREVEAIGEFETALRLQPSYHTAQLNLAMAENERGNALLRVPGRLDDAIQCYETALRDDPRMFGAHYNVALAYAEKGRLPDAVRHMEIAAQLAPGNAEIREMLTRMRAASR